MLTQNFQKILNDLNIYFDKDTSELNTDLIKMLNYTITHYSRNVFKCDANWKKISRKYDFDYEYVNNTDSNNDIINIEKEFRKYARIFKTINNIEKSVYINEYKKFISKTMDLMVNKIIIPIEIIMIRYTSIIEKYRNIYRIEPKKSPKLNYEVMQQLGL
jgi:hypothetical protein